MYLAANDPVLCARRGQQLQRRRLRLAGHRVRRVLHLQLVRAQRDRAHRPQHQHGDRRRLLCVSTDDVVQALLKGIANTSRAV